MPMEGKWDEENEMEVGITRMEGRREKQKGRKERENGRRKE